MSSNELYLASLSVSMANIVDVCISVNVCIIDIADCWQDNEFMDFSNFYVDLGARISELRRKKKLSQAELADLVSLSRASIANIESGRQQVLVHTLVAIAESLNVSISELTDKRESIEKSVKKELKGYDKDVQSWAEKILKPRE